MTKKSAPKDNITINRLAIIEIRRKLQDFEERIQILEKKAGVHVGPRPLQTMTTPTSTTTTSKTRKRKPHHATTTTLHQP